MMVFVETIYHLTPRIDLIIIFIPVGPKQGTRMGPGKRRISGDTDENQRPIVRPHYFNWFAARTPLEALLRSLFKIDKTRKLVLRSLSQSRKEKDDLGLTWSA